MFSQRRISNSSLACVNAAPAEEVLEVAGNGYGLDSRESAPMSDLSFSLSDTSLPVHECIEHPILPCPACWKWAGDAFATVRSDPKSFPGIIDLLPESASSERS